MADWQGPTQGGADNTQIVTAAQNIVVAINQLVLAVQESFPNWVDVPATASSTGTPGQVAYDATHFYLCVQTNVWVRATLSTF